MEEDKKNSNSQQKMMNSTDLSQQKKEATANAMQNAPPLD